METSDILSYIALGLSVISIGLSTYFELRDRSQLVLNSTFIPACVLGPPYILISISNSGRRPIIIRMWGGYDLNHRWVGTPLGKAGEGLRLGEKEWHEIKFHQEDIFNDTPNGYMEFVDLWIEDSLRHRYTIKNAKKNIKRLVKADI